MFLSNPLWTERKRATIKIRAKILDAARSWFRRHNYVEVQGPILVPAIGDWPSYFEVKYFDRKAYLAQGLHAIEAEIPQSDLNNLINIQEQLICHILQKLSNEAQEQLEIIQRDTKELESIQNPFPRLTYDDAIKMLQKDGFDVQWGAVLDWEHEEHLSRRFSQPFFISEFPVGIETFFFQSHPQKPEITLSVDLFAPGGYGEIATGGQPTVDREELLRKMKEEEMSPDERKWYMDLKAIGSVPHSGFAIGVERLTQWVCRLENIREASAFPRSTDNIFP